MPHTGSNPGLAEDFAREHSPHATALQADLLLTRLSLALDSRWRDDERAAPARRLRCGGAARRHRARLG